MKKYFFLLVLVLSFSVSFSQQADTTLDSRLQSYIISRRAFRLEELLDYTYPPLFTIASREQMGESLRQMYDNEYFTMRTDSFDVLRISSDFASGEGHYRKIDYHIVSVIVLKDTSRLTAKNVAIMSARLLEEYEKSFSAVSIYFDPADKAFHMAMNAVLVALKDKAGQPWYFLNYQKDEPMLTTILPPGVGAHFGF